MIPFLISAFLIGVSKYCIETLQTSDTEYWGGWAVVPQVKHRFERKHFQDFAYISVEPPAWATFLVFVLVTALNLGLSYWIINNDHQEGAVGWGRYSWRGRL